VHFRKHENRQQLPCQFAVKHQGDAMITADDCMQQDGSTIANDSLLPWIVCLSAALFFFYEFIQMHMFNSISPGLMQDFSVDAESLGYLSATYLYADVAFLLPAGLILDHFSTRRVILLSMSLCVGGTLGFAISHTIFLASLFHFLSGIGNAFCFLACMTLTSRWFPAEKRGVVVGIIVTMAMTGGLMAQTPLATLASSYGWRHALLLDSGLGFAIMALIWYFVADFPNKAMADAHAAAQPEFSVKEYFSGLKRAAKNTQTWFCGLYAGLLNLPIMILGAVYGDLYLNQVHGLPFKQATIATSMVFMGTIFGSLISGFVSDSLLRRRTPMIAGGVLSIATLAWIMLTPQMSFLTAVTAFLLLGLFTSTQVICYPMVIENNPSDITGTAMGLNSVLVMGSAAIAQPLFGFLLKWGWNREIINNIPHYSSADFYRGMMMIMVGFLAALMFILLAKETYCRAQHD
jgi:MFS family permease